MMTNMTNLVAIDSSFNYSLGKIFQTNGYSIEFTKAPIKADNPWKIVGDNETTAVIKGLIQGEKFAFRVTGIGKTPVIIYSDELFAN
jgi:hypothetical protein